MDKITKKDFSRITVNGIGVHLITCSNCHMVVVMTEDEYSKHPYDSRDYLRRNIDCCEAPAYLWDNTRISTFPEPKSDYPFEQCKDCDRRK